MAACERPEQASHQRDQHEGEQQNRVGRYGTGRDVAHQQAITHHFISRKSFVKPALDAVKLEWILAGFPFFPARMRHCRRSQTGLDSPENWFISPAQTRRIPLNLRNSFHLPDKLFTVCLRYCS
jgi:hypothetical protein